MQNKGAIRFLVIIVALVCIFQLSFTAVSAIQEAKADKYAEAAVQSARMLPSFKEISDLDTAFYIENIRTAANKFYLDSISSQKVFVGQTYKEVKEKEINLGLDLKGGMNVMLQLDMSELVRNLANDEPGQAFEEAMSLARTRSLDGGNDFITLFGEAWEEVAPGQKLYTVFNATNQFKDGNKTTNRQVIEFLQDEAQSAISNSYNVVQKRVDQFGVTQPTIQAIGQTGRLLIELPGVKEPERVRKLLQGTASLGFWDTYTTTSDGSRSFVEENVLNAIVEADRVAKELEEEAVEEVAEEAEEVAEAAVEEAPKTLADSLANELAEQNKNTALEDFQKEHPLIGRFIIDGASGSWYQGEACVARVHFRDTAKVGSILREPAVKELFPEDLVLMWSFKGMDLKNGEGESYFDLVAVRSHDEGPLLSGSVITNAMSNISMSGEAEVSMSMNGDGAKQWQNITANSIGRQVAIVMDGMVYSYPSVRSEIPNGSSQITGHFTTAEAEDLATVLKSGKLSAPSKIVQEQVVGPTLGSASIRAGLISFVLAFLLVLIYMAVFYRKAGLFADLALLCNVLFLFGALVSFGAVLTLPGIAGLVLTMGMAVDANVIIYERIKEELRAGKALRLAVKDGYKNAYSAIIDGQVTTILTGIILYIFGSGAVRGFAAVLIIGIITSVFTSIFVTRLCIDDQLKKNKDISFDSKFTRNFLQNTHVNFIDKKKWSYSISGAIIVISIAFMVFKGFTLGVDFSGGRTYVVRFDQPTSPEQVRANLVDELRGAEVKQFGGAAQMKITTQYKIDVTDPEEKKAVDREIEELLFASLQGMYVNAIDIDGFTSTLENPNGIVSSDSVDPTIASEIQVKAIWAVIFALIVIFAYIALRFRSWTYGMGGVCSLAHTAVIVIGFFSIFTGVLPFNLDVDQTFIAAVLTIIGYAINDNVVIFDRVREFRTLYPKRDLKQNVNEALNSTLSRTINTSVTTLIVLLAIAIFGGEVIRGFSTALILGVIVGTYASIFIGSPIMYDLEMRRAKKAAKKAGK